MATKMKSFDFTTKSKLTTTEKAAYPWDEWFDGDIWRLDQGEDFDGHPLMMERIIRNRATGKGVNVRMRHLAVNGDPWGAIVLQRTDVEGPMAAKQREANEKRAATKAAKKAQVEVTPAKAAKKGAEIETNSAKKPVKRLVRTK